MELTDYPAHLADQILEELRATLGNDALVRLMEARDAPIYDNIGTDVSPFMIELQDKILDILMQTTQGVIEQNALEDEIIERIRKEPGGKVYRADEYLALLEERLNNLPD